MVWKSNNPSSQIKLISLILKRMIAIKMILTYKAQVHVSKETIAISRIMSLVAHTILVATMLKRCAWVAITGSAEQKKLGLASTRISSIIRKAFAKIVISQSTIVNAKKRRGEKSFVRSKTTLTRKVKKVNHRLNKNLGMPRRPRRLLCSKLPFRAIKRVNNKQPAFLKMRAKLLSQALKHCKANKIFLRSKQYPKLLIACPPRTTAKFQQNANLMATSSQAMAIM